ncbi:MAG: ABC transporter permease subunit [Acetanaerobacterium sp.]
MLDFFGYTYQYVLIACGIYAALLGAQALAKEESDGTIEYLYAQPITRAQIVWQKLLACLASYALFVLTLSLTAGILFALLKPKDVAFVGLMTDMKLLMGGTLLSGAVFLCAGLMISTLLRSAGHATAVANGMVFFTYILGILSKMFSDKAEWAKGLIYLSPLDYAMPLDVLRHGFDAGRMLTGVTIIVVTTALAFYFYSKKDLQS